MNSHHHKIIPLKLGMTNCYLIRGGQDFVMVDAGPPDVLEKFRQKLEQLGINPSSIKQIFITHMHFDHMGSLPEIGQLTGAKSAMHHLDKELVEKGTVIMPDGIGPWGKFLTALLRTIKPMIKKKIGPVQVDQSLDDSPYSLDEFLINGKIIHTPGHTAGSISMVLQSGEAFVGDLAMSGFPRVSGPGPFVLGDDLETMKQSWQLLLDEGAKHIYPSHGEPFDAVVFKNYLNA
jgi:glyoxylase-like metal-dependent hydrolase (beta-lactamase superfamily II)